MPESCHMHDNGRTRANAGRADMPDAPAQPDTRSDLDPDVAQLLGLRPADADAIPTADEVIRP
jgi:hypothetical protein